MPSIPSAAWNAFRAEPTEATFAPVYEATHRLVYTVCYRILNNHDEALDAFQAAYARMLMHARRPEPDLPGDDPPRLALRLAVREAMNLKQRLGRRRRKEIAVDEPPIAVDPAPGPGDRAARGQLSEQLETLIRILPERERIPLQLHYLHGLSQAEIADALQVDKSTVSRRIEGGLRRLRVLAERAGLSPTLATLFGAAAAPVLLAPPNALAAAAVFAQAQAAALAAGGAGAAAGIGLKTIGGVMMKAKTAIWGAAALVGIAGLVTISVFQSNRHGADSRANRPAANVQGENPPRDATGGMPDTASIPRLAAGRDANASLQPVVASTPTPVPTPVGPLAAVAVLAQWQDTQTPAAGTSVTLAGIVDGRTESASFSGRTDEQGRLQLAFPDAYLNVRITAAQPLARLWRKDFSRSAAAGNALPDPLVIQLERGCRVFGRVVRVEGLEPVAGALVTARNPQSDPLQIVTDAQGRFAIDYLRPGAITLSAASRDGVSDPKDAAAQPLQLAAGSNYGPVDLLLHPAGQVGGIVRRSDTNAPIPGATVALDKQEDQFHALSGPDGRYELGGLPLNQNLILSAKAPRYAKNLLVTQLSAGQKALVDIPLDPAGTACITAVDQQRKAIPGARVTGNRPDDSYWEQVAPRTDADGLTLVEGLSLRKRQRLDVEKEGFERTSLEVAFPAGATSVSLTAVLGPAKRQTISLSGTIRDEAGQPLSGIKVRYAQSWMARRVKGVTTGADGRYDLPKQAYESDARVFATGKGWGAAWSDGIRPPENDQPVVIDLTLKPGHFVAGTVVNEQDEPLADVLLGLRAKDRDYAFDRLPSELESATSDGDGRFRIDGLPEMSFLISAQDRQKRYSPKTIEAVPDGETKIVLPSLRKIVGRVVDDRSGKPIAAFRIKVPYGAGLDSSQARLGFNYSDPDGRFEIKDLAAGAEYTLVVDAANYASRTVENVVPDKEDNKPIEIRLSKGTILRGRLLDKRNGSPLPGVTVNLVRLNSSSPNPNPRNYDWREIESASSQFNRQAAVTDSAGEFNFTEGEVKGALAIRIQGYARRLVLPDERAGMTDADGVLTIAMAPAASLSGICFRDGKPLPRASLALDLIQDRMNQGSFNGSTDDTGRFRWDELSAGRYSAYVFASFGDFGISSYTRENILLGEGEQKILNLGEDLGEAALFGQVREGGEPVSSIQITARPKFKWDYTSFQTISDQDGLYKLTGLRPGSYTVNLRAMGSLGDTHYQLEETVEVGGTKSHDFEFKPDNHVVGTLLVPAGKATTPVKVSLSFDRSGGQDNPPSHVKQFANAPVQNNRFELTGRFQGQYRLYVDIKGSDGRQQTVQVPRSLTIDNLDKDVDLGSIEVPATGKLHLQLVSSGGTAPQFAFGGLLLRKTEDPREILDRGLAANQLEQDFDATPAGHYEVRPFVPAFQCDPKIAGIEIKPGETATLSFRLIPEGWIMGAIKSGPKEVTPDRVVLTGPAGQRVVTPVAGGSASDMTMMFESEGDVVAGSNFLFRGLPSGAYTLRIEAAGYQPIEKPIAVQAGNFDKPMMIELMPVTP